MECNRPKGDLHALNAPQINVSIVPLYTNEGHAAARARRRQRCHYLRTFCWATIYEHYKSTCGNYVIIPMCM